jgi:hypothetical protein
MSSENMDLMTMIVNTTPETPRVRLQLQSFAPVAADSLAFSPCDFYFALSIAGLDLLDSS